MSGDKWEKSGKGFVNIHYRAAGEGQAGLNLMITTDGLNFLKGGDAVKEINLGEKTAYWSEFPIMEHVGGDSEPTVRTGHTLKWENNGLVYTLQDNGQFSQEEMLKIAASINAKPTVEK